MILSSKGNCPEYQLSLNSSCSSRIPAVESSQLIFSSVPFLCCLYYVFQLIRDDKILMLSLEILYSCLYLIAQKTRKVQYATIMFIP